MIFDAEAGGARRAYPDTLVGTDSHTTMINGLGVLGWGVGGIEAEAAMLGQPVTMLIPQVIGFRLEGKLQPGATATDLVLTVTEMLRKKGVVDKFVEFFGDGLANLPLADRATIANMAPEYGSTCGIFPIDAETVRYLELSGRPRERIELVSAYAKAQGMWRNQGATPARYTDELELDLGKVEPSLAGPRRPQDRVPLKIGQDGVRDERQEGGRRSAPRAAGGARGSAPVTLNGQQLRAQGRRGADRRDHELHQHVQSVGDARRRTAGAQGTRARTEVAALGEDQPRARLAGGDGLLHQGRRAGGSRGRRL